MTDDGVTSEFVAAPLRMFLVALLGAVFTGCSALLTFGIVRGGSRYEMALAFSYVVTPVGAIWTSSWLKKFLTLRGVVLSVGPDGLLDRRISDQLVPWSAIKKFSVREYQWSRFLLMEVDREFDARWLKALDARFFEIFNRPFGYVGYRISSFGISASLVEIEAAISNHRILSRNPGV